MPGTLEIRFAPGSGGSPVDWAPSRARAKREFPYGVVAGAGMESLRVGEVAVGNAVAAVTMAPWITVVAGAAWKCGKGLMGAVATVCVRRFGRGTHSIRSA